MHFAYLRDVSSSRESNRYSCGLPKMLTAVDGLVEKYVLGGVKSGRVISTRKSIAVWSEGVKTNGARVAFWV